MFRVISKHEPEAAPNNELAMVRYGLTGSNLVQNIYTL